MKYTIKTFRKDFPNDDRCLEYIFKARFPNAKGFHREKNTKQYSHQSGYKKIAPMAGTIFENSSTPLTLWFHAMYMFSTSKNGVSAKELERQLGVTYKTAWRMAKAIRSLMQSGNDKLTGVVEIDESYIGKKPVLGAIERGGKVRTKVSENLTGPAITSHVVKQVSDNSHIMSDMNKSYAWLDRHYVRESVNHGKEHVRGNVHINSMEAFWSQVKRSIAGTHHFVSPKHLQTYLDFFSFQHDYRASQVPLFLVLLGRACR